MARLTDQDRRELLEVAASAAIRRDQQTLAANRSRLFVRDGRVDIDRAVAFVIAFNEMIDHQPRPYRPILEREMKL